MSITTTLGFPLITALAVASCGQMGQQSPLKDAAEPSASAPQEHKYVCDMGFDISRKLTVTPTKLTVTFWHHYYAVEQSFTCNARAAKEIIGTTSYVAFNDCKKKSGDELITLPEINYIPESMLMGAEVGRMKYSGHKHILPKDTGLLTCTLPEFQEASVKKLESDLATAKEQDLVSEALMPLLNRAREYYAAITQTFVDRPAQSKEYYKVANELAEQVYALKAKPSNKAALDFLKSLRLANSPSADQSIQALVFSATDVAKIYKRIDASTGRTAAGQKEPLTNPEDIRDFAKVQSYLIALHKEYLRHAPGQNEYYVVSERRVALDIQLFLDNKNQTKFAVLNFIGGMRLRMADPVDSTFDAMRIFFTK